MGFIFYLKYEILNFKFKKKKKKKLIKMLKSILFIVFAIFQVNCQDVCPNIAVFQNLNPLNVNIL